jgi:hypothetical protein
MVFAVAELFEGADGVFARAVDAGVAGEDFGDEEGLGEEALDFAGAADDDFVVFRQLVDAENGDDILEVAVALEDHLDAAGDFVVALADQLGGDDARGAGERVDRGRCFFRDRPLRLTVELR